MKYLAALLTVLVLVGCKTAKKKEIGPPATIAGRWINVAQKLDSWGRPFGPTQTNTLILQQTGAAVVGKFNDEPIEGGEVSGNSFVFVTKRFDQPYSNWITLKHFGFYTNEQIHLHVQGVGEAFRLDNRPAQMVPREHDLAIVFNRDTP